MKFIATDPVAVMAAYCSIRDMGKEEALSAMLLDGPPGAGKSFFAKYVSSLLGGKFMHFQCFPGCGREDLLWDKDAEGKRLPGLLIQALLNSQTEKTVVLMDELDKADVRIDSFLLNMLQEGFISMPQLADIAKDGVIKANPANIIFFFTKNDQREASSPLMRRCRIIYMDWPSSETEFKILKAAVPELTMGCFEALMEPVRRLRENPICKKPPSTPELIRLAKDLAIMAKLDCSHEIIGKYYKLAITQNPLDRKLVEKAARYFGLSLKPHFQDAFKDVDLISSSIIDELVSQIKE